MEPMTSAVPMIAMATSILPSLAYLVIVMTVYSFGGWLWETAYCSLVERRFVRRGVLYGPVCPLYGFAVLFLYYPLMGVDDPVSVFMLGALLATAMEYGTAILLETTLRRSFWSYDDMPLNFHGRICLPASLVFGGFSLVARFVTQPAIETTLEGLPTDRMLDASVIISVVFCVDVVMSARRWEFDSSRLPASISIVIQRIPESVMTRSEIAVTVSDAIEALRDEIRLANHDRGTHRRIPTIRILSAKVIGTGRLLVTARIGDMRSVVAIARERVSSLVRQLAPYNSDEEIIRRAVSSVEDDHGWDDDPN